MSLQRETVLSGGFGASTNSARAGYLPVSLAHVPPGAFDGISIHLRKDPRRDPSGSGEEFALYRGGPVEFVESDRRRLVQNGVVFVYIHMSDQDRFRRQTETSIADTMLDPARAISEKSVILYETCVELVNELLTDPESVVSSPRLLGISQATSTLVLNNPTAFSHMFNASHHDFYTATHMVNVGTWMVPLAYELGIRDQAQLTLICQAGMMHDIGKIHVPTELLNKRGKLSKNEWDCLQRHPVSGNAYLAKFGDIDPMISTVARQHHERIDGSGYPDGLRGEQIHEISRLCAVVDCFDAMTAFRPFKERTLSVAQAVAILKAETPEKYDPKVMKVWLGLVDSLDSLEDQLPEPPEEVDQPPEGTSARRNHRRFALHCPARVHIMEQRGSAWLEKPGIPVVAHSISRSGVGFLSQTPFEAGDSIHIHLQVRNSAKNELTGEIVRCRTYQDGWYEVGVQFQAASPQPPPGEQYCGQRPAEVAGA